LLYIKVSSPTAQYLDFTTAQCTLLFTQSQFLWEEFSHAVINAQRLLVHQYPPLYMTRYSFIQVNEVEQTCPRFDMAAKD